MNNRLYNSIAQNFDLNYVFFLGHRKRARYRHRSEHSLCHLWDCVNAESCVTTHGKMLHEGNILFKLMLSPGKHCCGNICDSRCFLKCFLVFAHSGKHGETLVGNNVS